MNSLTEKKKVVVVAGPAGSGKDTIVKELLKRIPGSTLMVTATTRAQRPGEQDGINYHYLTNEQFLKELHDGNILEYYHREETDTYYGTYKKDIDARLAKGGIMFAVIQIVGAKYLKAQYHALTIFVVPPAPDALERRVRSRAPITDVEWQERLAHTKREIEEDAPWYDYRVTNEDGKLDEAVQQVMDILAKEGISV